MSNTTTDTEKKFNRAVAIVDGLPKEGPVKLSQDELLTFYKYFKKGRFGDATGPRPGPLEFVKREKWDKWNSVKDISQEDAQKAYVAKLLEVLKRIDTEEAKGWIAELE